MPENPGPRINSLSPAPGSRRLRTRIGRGVGCGSDKTAGRGHKGQKSRAGSGPKARFEGGQMPLHRRLPKFGFRSRIARVTARVRLSAIDRMSEELIDLETRKRAGVVKRNARRERVFLSGAINRSVRLQGLAVSRGARAAIEKAGGSVLDEAAGTGETD